MTFYGLRNPWNDTGAANYAYFMRRQTPQSLMSITVVADGVQYARRSAWECQVLPNSKRIVEVQGRSIPMWIYKFTERTA